MSYFLVLIRRGESSLLADSNSLLQTQLGNRTLVTKYYDKHIAIKAICLFKLLNYKV